MKQTKSAAAEIRAFKKHNPNATPKDIAQAIGTSLANVYATFAYDRGAKKATAKKAAAKKTVNKWKTLTINTSNDNLAQAAVHLKHLMPSAGQPHRVVYQTEAGDGTMKFVKPPESDSVNHPAHYKVGGIETIDFIEAKKLGYNLGNVVKYITRADHKGNKLEDLRKAQWYLTREISTLK
jgi:hypothetical protein